MNNQLAEIKVNKKKVMLYVAIRMVLFVICAFGCFVAGNYTSNPNYIGAFVFLAIILVYACSPFRHWNDTLTYYKNKIVLNKKELTFNHPTELKWMRQKTYLTGTRLLIHKTSEKKNLKAIFFDSSNQMDITYMDKPKETFIKCYLNQA